MSLQQSPGLTRAFTVVVVIFLLTAAVPVSAASSDAADAIPHVSNKARDDFPAYLSAGKNRAFAIAPGGAWAWRSDAVSEAEAEQQALQSCQSYTRQKCVLYALNDRIVFDEKRWPTLWGPYLGRQAADSAAVGTAVGERFHDLIWKDEKGKQVRLSGLRGRIVFLHFWGSWCPPCLREFPSLKKLHAEIKTGFSSDVKMVMLQLREAFEESSQWVQQYGFSDLPVYDSGADSEVTTLTLSDGSTVQDRGIARVFPSTYVLDRNGIVVFSHHGPVNDWLDYLPFIKHAVTETGNNTVQVRAIDEKN